MSRPDLTLVIPVYNEAARLDPEQFLRTVDTAERVHFLFVDDGSTDDTAAIVAQLAARAPNRIALLSLASNRGKAEAVRAGLSHALAHSTDRFVGFWDADLATPLSAIADFLGVLDRVPGIEAVIGARVQLLGRRIRRRAVRHYLGRVFATGASLALGIPVYDTQCGAKIFRRTGQLANALARPWRSQWIFDVELLQRLLAGRPDADSVIWEQPVSVWTDVPGSHLRASDFLRAPIDLLMIWRARRGA